MQDSKNHWESVYKSKNPSEVSWYQPHLKKSLAFISKTSIPKNASIVDVGGGASTLVEDLLHQQYEHITVVDLSSEALKKAKDSLGKLADQVTWIEADITKVSFLENSSDLWHDRAAFHFLINPDDRKRYISVLLEGLKPNGHLIIATFSLQGPERCSGLDVVRYDPQKLQIELGDNFELMGSEPESHKTPFGTVQNFIYCWFRKK